MEESGKIIGIWDRGGTWLIGAQGMAETQRKSVGNGIIFCCFWDSTLNKNNVKIGSWEDEDWKKKRFGDTVASMHYRASWNVLRLCLCGSDSTGVPRLAQSVKQRGARMCMSKGAAT